MTGLPRDAYAHTGDLEKNSDLFRVRRAIFDDTGAALQLRELSEAGGEQRRSAGMGAEAGGEEKDAAKVHAEGGAAVVPEGEGAAERVSGVTPAGIFLSRKLSNRKMACAGLLTA